MLTPLCLLLAVVVDRARAHPGHSHDAHRGHHRQQSSFMPRRSDVIFTSRSPHLAPPFPTGVGLGSGKLGTWQAAQKFHASRLDWVYTVNRSFVADALGRQNMSSISLAMNPQVPDSNGKTYATGRVLNVHGEPLVAPWMRSWKTKRPYGCVNNPDYKELAFARARLLVALGTSVIQHDDPTSNAEAVSWNNGNPEESGCYCDVVHGFTQTLNTTLNEKERAALNITASFNYRNYLLSLAPFNTTRGPSNKTRLLRSLFVDYQRNATRRYLAELRQNVTGTLLSCNNGGQWDRDGNIYESFDYGMGELSEYDANPGGLRDIFVANVPAGKKQVMTMPKSKNATEDGSGTFARLAQVGGAKLRTGWKHDGSLGYLLAHAFRLEILWGSKSVR